MTWQNHQPELIRCSEARGTAHHPIHYSSWPLNILSLNIRALSIGRLILGPLSLGRRRVGQFWCWAWLLTVTAGAWGADVAPQVPDFSRDVQPILNRYCAGCHGPAQAEEELRLDRHDLIMAGSENGAVIRAGDSENSRLYQLISGAKEPQMPPPEEPQLDAAAREILRRWIDGGAPAAAAAEPSATEIVTPKVSGESVPRPVTALAADERRGVWARGDFGRVVIAPWSAASGSETAPRAEAAEASTNPAAESIAAASGRSGETWIGELNGFTGKVTALAFSADGRQLFVAAGFAGSPAEVSQWDLSGTEPQRVARWQDHDDVVYALAVSGHGRLASAGYDKKIVVRDLASQKVEHRLTGHNGAIFDLDFSPDSRVLVSASADATVKVWQTATGERLDTLSQPTKEQYTVDISPDGRWIVAGGEDNRLRVWQLISIERPEINPLLIARYGHDGAIHRARFLTDSLHVVSVAADQQIKLWSVPDMTLSGVVAEQPASTQQLAVGPQSQQLAVGRMDGSWEIYPLGGVDSSSGAAGSPLANSAGSDISADPQVAAPQVQAEREVVASVPGAGGDAPQQNWWEGAEAEPNNEWSAAQEITLPCRVQGVIEPSAGVPSGGRDLYRFTAQEGETWIFEVLAARDKSPLDSVLAVWDRDGAAVPRVQLRAIRDSYFTFRGKDSVGTGDFRLQNWEEMRLNQLLYANGEVVKLYHYPRGPDSGFNVYPNFGQRQTFFETSPLAHALNSPCYIVEPHPPGEQVEANGLPVFTVPYENDDASDGKLGADSRLTFTAPYSGEFLVGVRDVRGVGGDNFRYRLEGRRPQPGFTAQLVDRVPQVTPGTGVRFGVQVDRRDGYEGPITIRFSGVPDGVELAQPLVVEAGHLRAWGTVYVTPEAAKSVAWADVKIGVTAEAEIAGKLVQQAVGDFGPIEIQEQKSAIRVEFSPHESSSDAIEIVPGTTVTAQIRIDRRGFEGRVGFGSEEAVWNTPHGIYVANTGLNGVLIVEGAHERTVFLTAEPWVQPMERWVFIEADVEGKPTSRPIRLRVLPRPHSVTEVRPGEP